MRAVSGVFSADDLHKHVQHSRSSIPQEHAFLIERRAFGFESSGTSYPLDDVVGFGLYSQKGNRGNDSSYDISVQLKSSRLFGLAGETTNQAGYNVGVDALNDFLIRTAYAARSQV